MKKDAFSEVYKKFKIYFYKNVFNQIQNRELSLTTVEVFCVEIIDALKNPTINEFANFINISSPNAAYKVNSLIQKGYVKKIRSDTDKREYHLTVTDKYYKYYNISQRYVDTVLERIRNNFSKEEVDLFEKMFEKITDELMPEVNLDK